MTTASPGQVWAGVTAMGLLGATAVGLRWAARPPAVREIRMGPGGWVSFKNASARRPTAPRPVWARLLHASPTS